MSKPIAKVARLDYVAILVRLVLEKLCQITQVRLVKLTMLD